MKTKKSIIITTLLLIILTTCIGCGKTVTKETTIKDTNTTSKSDVITNTKPSETKSETTSTDSIEDFLARITPVIDDSFEYMPKEFTTDDYYCGKEYEDNFKQLGLDTNNCISHQLEESKNYNIKIHYYKIDSTDNAKKLFENQSAYWNKLKKDHTEIKTTTYIKDDNVVLVFSRIRNEQNDTKYKEICDVFSDWTSSDSIE